MNSIQASSTARTLSLSTLRIAGASAALVASSLVASAQVTFSIDFHGPTRAAPSCGVGPLLITEGDILAACVGAGLPGMPQMPVNPGPLRPPIVAFPAGLGGLGIPTYAPCVGVGPGISPCPGLVMGTVEVDALSYGQDGPYIPSVIGPPNGDAKGHWHFSVDEYAIGLGGPIPPSVRSESAPGFAGDAAADVFVDLGLTSTPGIPPLLGAASHGNSGLWDGNGRLSVPARFAYPGTGLIEPTAPAPFGTFPPDPGDNLDAYDIDGPNVTFPGFPVYFSMDAAFFDPRNGFPNSGTAAANGFAPGDVVVSPAAAVGPILFAPAAALGLDVLGPGTDDLDALILWENGTNAFEPSMQPYDWGLGGGSDMLLFSVRTGSAVIGMPDSIHGAPIEPGDILTTPLATGLSPFPGIFIPAEDLGLQVSGARAPLGPLFGDDLDAADYRGIKPLLATEYCYGDGGIGGCTACPFGNDMPAGTQTGCMNSAGQGARLTATGLACASADTLRFQMTGGNPNTFALLVCASSRLPLALACPPGSGISQPMILDGLRCIGPGFTRIQILPTDVNGDVGITNAGWGPGIISSFLLPVCQERQFQVFYRGMLPNGVNTSNAVQVITLP